MVGLVHSWTTKAKARRSSSPARKLKGRGFPRDNYHRDAVDIAKGMEGRQEVMTTR
jgi:hypothetical protein